MTTTPTLFRDLARQTLTDVRDLASEVPEGSHERLSGYARDVFLSQVSEFVDDVTFVGIDELIHAYVGYAKKVIDQAVSEGPLAVAGEQIDELSGLFVQGLAVLSPEAVEVSLLERAFKSVRKVSDGHARTAIDAQNRFLFTLASERTRQAVHASMADEGHTAVSHWRALVGLS